MKAFEAVTSDESGTRVAGRALGAVVGPGDVVLLCGDLGAGKTVLAKGLAEELGVAEPVTSPTFNILLMHEGRLPLYHFDLYRLDRADMLEDVDYFGTIEADGVALVEWGDRFVEAEPPQGLLVTITIEGDRVRRIHVEPKGPRGEALLAAWFDRCRGIDEITAEPVR